MKTAYERRLDKSFRDVPVLLLQPQDKAVLFSDCHRGVGNANDNFLKNQHLYFAALKHYYASDFTYIELGDGEELWENRSFKDIAEIHDNIYWLFSLFQKKQHFYMIYGNHDHVMKDCRKFVHYPGIVLQICDRESGEKPWCRELYLTHGHQADALNSSFWKLSRFLVRYFWKPLEQVGVLDPTSAAKNYRRRTKNEKRLCRWAEKNDRYLVTGHTHRPALGNEKDHYFNTGSCVHPRCITCIEIEAGNMCLVKWHMDTRADQTLFVNRSVLAGPVSLYKKEEPL